MIIISTIAKVLLALLLFATVYMTKQREGESMGNYNVKNSLVGAMIYGVLIALSWL